MKLGLISAAALALIACGGAQSTTPPPQAPPPSVPGGAVTLTSGGAAALPYAPAGTEVQARLDQSIDTRTSRPGDSVTATLNDAIRSAEGDVLIPAGTKVKGKIASIDRVNGSNIVLDFDALALPNGPAPVGFRVLSAEEERYNVTPLSSGVTNVQPMPGNHPPEGATTTEIVLKKGATIDLALTRPIVSAVPAKKPAAK